MMTNEWVYSEKHKMYMKADKVIKSNVKRRKIKKSLSNYFLDC